MEYKSVKGFTGWAQLGFLFAFLGLGVVLAGAVQLFFTAQLLPPGVKLANQDSKALMKLMLAPENVSIVRISQVAGTLLLLFLPAVLWSVVSNGKNMFWLGFNKYVNIKQILIGFLVLLAASIVASPLADLSKMIIAHFPSFNVTASRMEDEYTQQALALSDLHGWSDYIIAMFIMAFFPAMFEEVFFRGAVQNLLTKWLRKPVVSITISSFVFSLIHMSVYLFLSRFVLGFALGLMFYETRNIWTNIIAHFINNAMALSILFFSPKGPGKDKMEQIDPHFHWAFGLLGFAALAGLLILLKKVSADNKLKIEAKENLLIAEADPHRAFADTQTN